MTSDQAEMTRRPIAKPGSASDPRAAGLLGVLDLADRLGTSERFVRRLVAERRVPFHKVGKYVRFDPRDIDTWLANHRVEPIS